MFAEYIRPDALAVLKALATAEFFRFQDFYLAGGTGLALQIGHRLSEDLDFFSGRPFGPEALVRSLSGRLTVTVMGATDDTLHVFCGEGIKTSFFFYPYQLVYPVSDFESCPVADSRDIAAMKLVAVGQRGTRKDFVDLYFLLRDQMTLSDLKDIVARKFAGVRYSWPHLVRSLAYFEEAERDPMPVMAAVDGTRDLTQAEWRQIKDFFRKLQKEALRQMRS